MRSLYGLFVRAVFLSPVCVIYAQTNNASAPTLLARFSTAVATLEPAPSELNTLIYESAPLSHSGTMSQTNILRSAPTVNTTVEVRASSRDSEHDAPSTFRASAEQILSSAGTFGDFSRYLQLFPGVVFNSDQSNSILVRGGNPIENLYLVDGIEIPNINHISSAASTGGFASMIDTAIIQDVNLRSGGYDASFNERLSSVIEIHSRDSPSGGGRRSELNFGITGAGGISEWGLPNNGAMLFSFHRSLLDIFTNDIGLNGTPIYTNALSRVTLKPTASDRLTLLSLGGIDSININPDAGDKAETITIDTQYSGWRYTNGVQWQHIYSPRTFGAFTLSQSEQSQRIDQQDQLLNGTVPPGGTLASNLLTPIYHESTRDGLTSIGYD